MLNSVFDICFLDTKGNWTVVWTASKADIENRNDAFTKVRKRIQRNSTRYLCPLSVNVFYQRLDTLLV